MTQSVSAQTCLNYISVNNVRPDAPTACYFLSHNDSSNAFARVDVLASALNFLQRYDAEQGHVVLTRGSSQLTLASTEDVGYGLIKRVGVLQASTNLTSGDSFDSPMAIYVDNAYYVPVAPIVRAFGGDAMWHRNQQTIAISITDASADVNVSANTNADVNSDVNSAATTPPATAPPVTADVSNTANVSTAVKPSDRTAVVALGVPRVGIHEAYTRVAIDLPEGADYSLAVAGDQSLVVAFTGSNLAPDSARGGQIGSDYVTAWQYQTLNGNLALVIQTEHRLATDGQGFQVGFLPREGDRVSDVLYLDFSSERQGPVVNQVPVGVLGSLAGIASASAQVSTSSTLSTSLTPSSIDVAETNVAENATPDDPTLRPNGAVTRTVVIDPGHGGYDPGAQGYVSEEVVVLDIALKVRELLEAQDINVILSRDDDYHLDARKATDLAARAAMASPDRNLFVSIHANAAENSRAHGIETWIFGEPLEEDLIQNAIIENGGGSVGLQLTEEAKRVHDSVINDIFRQEQLYYSQTLAEAVQASMIDATGATDRGIRKNYFYVIRNASIPAVLVEVGFVSNPEEGRNLAREDYRTQVANGIAEGIVAFFEQDGALVDHSN